MPIGNGIGLSLRNFPMGGSGEVLPPAVITAPVIDNLNPTVGDTLSFARGTYTNSPTSYTQEWKADGVGTGVTTLTFVVSEAQAGFAITVEEIAYNAVGNSGPNTSDATALVTQIPTWPTPAVITSNADLDNPLQGDILTADGSACIGQPAPNLLYDWQKSLEGTGPWGSTLVDTVSITLGALESNYTIRCVITGSNSVGDTPSNSNVSGIVF